MLLNPLHLYRNAYRGLSPSVWLLSGVMLINRCGTMVLPYLTLYMTQQLRFTVQQAGIVMALFGAGAVLGAYMGGRLTDRFGFAPVQLYSLFFGGFFLLGLQFVSSFAGMCVATFCFTLLGDTFRPANSSAIAHYSTEATRTIGIGVLLTGLAYALLPTSQWPGWALITILLMTAGEILAMPFMQSMAVTWSNEQNRGQYMALYSMAWAFSQLISPFVGSQIVGSAGFTTLWWVAAGACGISATGFWLLSRTKS